MPMYPWECRKCGEVTDVKRSIHGDDHERGPEEDCKCGARDFKRIIVIDPKAPNYILEGGGWHRDCYTKNRSIK